jgi:hypothetical protein
MDIDDDAPIDEILDAWWAQMEALEAADEHREAQRKAKLVVEEMALFDSDSGADDEEEGNDYDEKEEFHHSPPRSRKRRGGQDGEVGASMPKKK